MPADISAVGGRNGTNGIAFLVSAGIVFEIIAFACSSPQTAELNIRTREETLMKWVRLGEGLGVVFVLLAAWFEPKHARPIFTGGAVAVLSSEAFYGHARRSGLEKGGPPTEQSYSPTLGGLSKGTWAKG